jgi:hypothetical protein
MRDKEVMEIVDTIFLRNEKRRKYSICEFYISQ